MHSYSLRLLFVLVTAAATLAAALSGLLDSDVQFVGTGAIIAITLVCGLAGAILGLVIGMHDFDRARGVALGLGAGAVVGVLISPLVYIDGDAAPRIFAAEFGGALILVTLGISARLARK